MVTVVTILTAIVLALGYLTIRDMHNIANPVVMEIEAGTFNLIGNDLTTAVEELDEYIFYTNTTQMAVSVQGEGAFQGSLMLWNAANSEDYMIIYRLNGQGERADHQERFAAMRCMGYLWPTKHFLLTLFLLHPFSLIPAPDAGSFHSPLFSPI